MGSGQSSSGYSCKSAHSSRGRSKTYGYSPVLVHVHQMGQNHLPESDKERRRDIDVKRGRLSLAVIKTERYNSLQSQLQCPFFTWHVNSLRGLDCFVTFVRANHCNIEQMPNPMCFSLPRVKHDLCSTSQWPFLSQIKSKQILQTTT